MQKQERLAVTRKWGKLRAVSEGLIIVAQDGVIHAMAFQILKTRCDEMCGKELETLGF